MTDLEALRQIPLPSLQSQHPPKSVSLSKLQTLNITDNARRALAIVNGLELPASTITLISLDCNAMKSASQVNNLLTQVDHIIGSHLASACSSPGSGFETLILSSAPDYRGVKTEHHGFQIALEHALDSSGPKTWRFALYNLREPTLKDASPLRHVLMWPNFCSVKRVAIWHASFQWAEDSITWQSVMDTLPGVEIIEPEARVAQGFAHALKLHSALLPQLKKIIIRRSLLAAADVDALSKGLQARATAVSLSIFRCDVEKDGAERLKHIVTESGATFYWDKRENAVSAIRSVWSFGD
ncbi:unnamed protein product [Peniophora sp. CBMAI 1063]|nr:unnamed protein product [Peniophora sp. CBMAI 1063]